VLVTTAPPLEPDTAGLEPAAPARADDPSTLDRAQLALLGAIAATCFVSIFAAAIFLALATAVLIVRLLAKRTELRKTALDAPIVAFIVWTLLSASFSPDPVKSHQRAKKLVHFALLYVAIDSLRDEKRRGVVMDAALLGGLVLGASSLTQYYFLGFDTLDNRPRGFLGHYMTASGLLMAAVVLAAARIAYWRGALPRPGPQEWRRAGMLAAALAGLTVMKRLGVFPVKTEWVFVAGLSFVAARFVLSRRGPTPQASLSLAGGALVVCSWAIVLSQTRNAWLGMLSGLAVVALLRAPRTLWLLVSAVALVFILRPATVLDRMTVTDASSRDRIYMWQAGVDMIQDKPIFGQGPDMIQAVYPTYRWPGAPNPEVPHLHSNAFQIAAERGLPCLVWWLWWFAAALGDAYRLARGGGDSAGWGGAVLGVLVAILVAGMFEYNFGDSEILMLVLLVSALPYSLRPEKAAA
jgi:O-antigen ligase